MNDELKVRQKISRHGSPLMGERSPKRSCTSLEPAEAWKTLKVISVVEHGDALLVVDGSQASSDMPVGFRVSSIVISMVSPTLKVQLASAAEQRDEEPKTVLKLSGEKGNIVLLVCNLAHHRNDQLSAHLTADELHELALFSDRFGCGGAIGRATFQWFDHLYHKAEVDQTDLCKIVEAAYLLDQAVWFTRFSSRWVLKSSLLTPMLPSMHTIHAAKLALTLHTQQTSSHLLLHMDLDTLVDVAARCFAREFKHYIDWAPEMTPDPSDTPTGKVPVHCRVDGDGGQVFMGALRDANIWPSAVWYRRNEDNSSMRTEDANRVTIGDVVRRMAEFQLPEYDDADYCEFCDGVKAEFAAAVEAAKTAQRERVWGLCLDCFKAGGANDGECRFEHAKVSRKAQEDKQVAAPAPEAGQGKAPVQSGDAAPQAEQQVQQPESIGGLGIEGL